MSNELTIQKDITNINLLSDNNKIEVKKGDIFSIANEQLRVLDVREAGITTINLETNEISSEKCNSFVRLIETGNLKKVKIEPFKFVEISETEMSRIKEKAELLEYILDEMYPHWEKLFMNKSSKACYDEVANKLGICRKHVRRLLKMYLRSGRDMFSLVDKRKFNKRAVINPETSTDPRKNINLLYKFALSEFKRTGSIQTAYDNLLRQYFRTEVFEDGGVKMVLLPKEEITVSYKQVRSYIEKNLGGLTIKQWKSGERNVMNNERLLPGDVKYGLSRLGQRYEVDECEIPCYVVNPHTGQVVGKPIMYIISDEYAGIVTGCYVSYDNNSCKGIRQAMLSMLEPHANQTDKYELFYPEHVFPSMCMPKEIRCDHGSEYKSKTLEKMFAEIGIDLSLVPVSCGSLKGLVEGLHNRVQTLLIDNAANEGVVKEEYRGGDRAKGEACLTLENIRKIVYDSILYVNQVVIDGYCHDLEQLKTGLIPTPANIYEFERKRSGDPRNVYDENRDRYLFAFLAREDKRRKFSIGRKGINYVGHPLYFFTEEPWFIDMLLDEKEKDKIEIRYDETNIGCVFVSYKGVIRKVPLSAKRESQLTYMGIDWDSYDEMYKSYIQSDKLKQEKINSQNRKYQLQDRIEDIVGTARLLQGPATKYGKAPKEVRRAERQELQKNPDEIINRMYHSVDEPKKTIQPADFCEIEEKEQVPMLIEKEVIKTPQFTSPREQAEYLVGLLGLEDE